MAADESDSIQGETPTLAHVAQLAGVSAATVSRYLNYPGVVAGPTAARIAEAISQIGYVPNLVAGGLASKRSRLVALFLPVLDQSIFASAIQAMVNTLADEGYQVVMALTGAQDERLESLVPTILGRRTDGIILTGPAMPPALRKRLQRAGVPIIETWDLPATPIDSAVGFSHEAIGRALGEHVVAKGYKRPYVLSTAGSRAAARREGFNQTVQAHGLAEPPHRLVDVPTTFTAGRQALADVLAEGERPDVILCASDWLAHGVMTEAAGRGLHVPGDMAVIGFGDLEFASSLSPSLTTVAIDGAAIGRETAHLFLERAQGRAAGSRIIDVGFRFIARESG